MALHPQITKQLVWRSIYFNTMEYVSLEVGETISVDGYITGEAGGTPVQVRYQLVLDETWNVKSISITRLFGDKTETVTMNKDRLNHWHADGSHLSDFDNCIDIDIILTPFTNSLPINRLNLSVGDSREIDVLYFNLLESVTEPAKQRYTRIDTRQYRYESLSSGFTTVIKVDDNGFVIDYPGLWERVFPAGTSEKSTDLNMIARIWHGWTTLENADKYETLLKNEIIPGIRSKGIRGFKDMQVLKYAEGEKTRFTTIMWFDNLESVKEFAGEDYETAYVPVKARELLAKFDEKSEHHEVRWSMI